METIWNGARHVLKGYSDTLQCLYYVKICIHLIHFLEFDFYTFLNYKTIKKILSQIQHVCNPQFENPGLMCSVVSLIYHMVNGFVFDSFRVHSEVLSLRLSFWPHFLTSCSAASFSSCGTYTEINVACRTAQGSTLMLTNSPSLSNVWNTRIPCRGKSSFAHSKYTSTSHKLVRVSTLHPD